MLTPSQAIAATLKVGAIYKFSASELISTEVYHYFVVVAIEDEDNYVVVCTTKIDNRLNYIRKRGLPLDTLRFIAPNDNNGLTEDTYIDCNNYFTISKSQLVGKVSQEHFSTSGNLSEEEYNGVKESIILSPLNDIPDDYLNYK